MNTKLALSIAALGFASLTQLAHADSLDYELAAQPVPASKLTRAEVSADLILWQRAGLDRATLIDGYTANADDTERRKALYLQWRSGPEYVAELSRQQGAQPNTAKAPSAQTLN